MITRKLFSLLLMSALLPGLILLGGESLADTKQAHALQQQAVARLDHFISHFRRTFDRTLLISELATAETELGQSVQLFQVADDLAGSALSLIKIGDVRRYRDQWQEAVNAYQTAASAAKRANSPALLCQALLGHARALLYGYSEADAAKALIREAIPLAHQLEDSKCTFDSLDLLAQVQIAQGDIAGAADSLNRAFAGRNGVDDDSLLFYGYLDRAELYQKVAEKCDYQRDFEPCLQAVVLSARDYGSAQGIAKKLGWDALADQTRGFLRRLKIRKQMIESQRRMHTLVRQTDLFSPRTAEDVFLSPNFVAGPNVWAKGLLTWIESQGGLPVPNDARGAYIRGLFSEMNGDTDRALESYLRATDLLEQDRGTLKEERSRGAFIEDKVDFYYTALLHLLQRGRTAEAFELMERSRSRVMLDLIKTKEISLASTRERELYGRQLALGAKISQYQNCLFAARSDMAPVSPLCASLETGGSGTANDERGVKPIKSGVNQIKLDISGLQQALKRLQNQYRQLEAEVAKRAPRLNHLTRSEPVSLSALQKTLAADGSELVAYLTLHSQLLIWHITRAKVIVHSVFLPRSELKRKIAALRKSLIDPMQPYDENLAHQLYLYLLSPIMDQVKSNHLVIVPHEDLYYLPFQALYQSAGKGYVGAGYEITYAPSASILSLMPAPQPLGNPSILAAADPSLGFAPGEVQALGTHFRGMIVADRLMTESALKASVSGKQLVHLAVHGSFVADEPLLSYLHLKKDSVDDGRLTAAEMYGLSLDSARLVALSACETGSVKATHANEVLGMMRGLLFAGGDALLLSSWKIDDSATASWMQTFYNAADRYTPAQASVTAIKALLNNPAYQHPYYWSPFLLVSR
ncbi:CHAT domain-containing protein [Desulfobacter curvatus]|uniref:CHAT domain-containing protein n=1 Tax=Desulfobacter curvatus TaxID=2290 RepID=UPI000376CB30|nr:CHAT domain-containing protein [Desulfobacter curvatus]